MMQSPQRRIQTIRASATALGYQQTEMTKADGSRKRLTSSERAPGMSADAKDEANVARASSLTRQLRNLRSPRDVNFVVMFDPEPTHHRNPVLAEKKQRAGIFVGDAASLQNGCKHDRMRGFGVVPYCVNWIARNDRC